jgi:L-aspartate oxidase
MQEDLQEPRLPPPIFRTSATGRPAPAGRAPDDSLTEEEVRTLMWQRVGLFREAGGLSEAVGHLQPELTRSRPPAPLPDGHDWRRANIGVVAALIAAAALRREESRGGHFRSDFPQRDDEHWKIHVTDRIDLDTH